MGTRLEPESATSRWVVLPVHPFTERCWAAWLRAGESSAWRILMSRTPRRLSAGCPPAGRLLVVGVALPVDGGYTAR